MKRKRGRPSTGVVKKNRYGVRLTDEEDMKLKYIRYKTGYSTTKIFVEALKMYYEYIKYRN